jgi:hypothetical protein
MYLVMIAWFYVALMASLAEAASPSGTLLGALVTFVLYGLLPMGIVGYIMHTPARKRARQQAREQVAQALAGEDAGTKAPSSDQPNSTLTPNEGRHATGDTVSTERKEV